jgi:hypothetical protein
MTLFSLRAVASLMLLLLSTAAAAQDYYPNRPITIVVGFQADSGVDVQTRVFAQALGEKLGSRKWIGTAVFCSGRISSVSTIEMRRFCRCAPGSEVRRRNTARAIAAGAL